MTNLDSLDLLDHFRQEAVVTKQHTIHIDLKTNRSQGRHQVKVETRWTRDEIIGSGAFGDVWLESRQKGDGLTKRAIKVISKRRMQDCNIDYKKELLALAKFSKRSYRQEDVLVEFFGWYEDTSHLFISMEYFELGDLSQHITTSLSEEDARQITTDLLHGLRIIHREKFAHRDLKPKNIFVVQKPPAPCWWVKIGDFGISKRACGETELHTQIGTALYKAPEISGYYESTDLLYGYDQAVDMWSLGCVLYELLTQNVPFPNALAILKFCDGKTLFPEEKILHKVGSQGIAFIKSLVLANPRHRLTAEAALESHWIVCQPQSRDVLPDLQELVLEENGVHLRRAAQIGDLKTVQRLLDKGVDINAVDAESWTPLNLASYHGKIEVAEFLAKNGASFDIFNDKGNGPWHSATLNAHLDIIRLFVREQLNPCVMNNAGRSPLGIASMNGHLQLGEFLLRSGARIHENSKIHTECCLNIAVMAGRTEMIRLFLHGVTGSVLAEKSCRINALILAAALGRLEGFRLLSETIGCDVLNEDGLSPLIVAAAVGQREMVEYLSLGTYLNDVVMATSSDIASDKFPCILLPRALVSGGEYHQLGTPSSRQLFLDSAMFETTSVNIHGLTPLIAACQTGQLWIVQLLLQHGADPNVGNRDGITPLIYAVFGGHFETVHLLLEMGSDPNRPDKEGNTPLLYAASEADVDIIKSLLDSGAILQPNSSDRNALYKCAQKDHTEVLELLLHKFKRHVRDSNRYGVTLLHTAADHGMITTVKFLVEKGAEVNAASVDKWTPLHNAAQNGYLDVAEFLHDHGANINATSLLGISPLHDAAGRGQTRMVQFLINKGAKLNALTSQNETALFLAVYHDQSETVSLLLEKGSDFTLRTKENKIALQHAIMNGSVEITRLLLEKGASSHFYKYTHLTPLMYALQLTNSKLISFLIDQEVDQNILSGDGKTALQIAVLWGQTDGVDGLLKRGADPNAHSSGYSSSPLYCAADGEHTRMVQLLLDAGANGTTHNTATLNVALSKGLNKIVEILLDKGTNVNADISESGLKPLHKASFLGNLETVQSLLKAGADIDATDSIGYTALHHAVQYNRSKIVGVLLESGADAKRRSNNGASPLDLAAQNGRKASVAVFEKHGLVVRQAKQGQKWA